jgi:hypothetical protein
MINLMALVPALLTAAALVGSRRARRETPGRLVRWGDRAIVSWGAVAVGALVAFGIGMHLQHADLAVWSAFGAIAAGVAALTAVAVRLATSFTRPRLGPR